jgi:hypothetical protein
MGIRPPMTAQCRYSPPHHYYAACQMPVLYHRVLQIAGHVPISDKAHPRNAKTDGRGEISGSACSKLRCRKQKRLPHSAWTMMSRPTVESVRTSHSCMFEGSRQ